MKTNNEEVHLLIINTYVSQMDFLVICFQLYMLFIFNFRLKQTEKDETKKTQKT